MPKNKQRRVFREEAVITRLQEKHMTRKAGSKSKAKQPKLDATHGGIRLGHSTTVRRGFLDLRDNTFRVTDEGHLYIACCQCGEKSIGDSPAEALMLLSK